MWYIFKVEQKGRVKMAFFKTLESFFGFFLNSDLCSIVCKNLDSMLQVV